MNILRRILHPSLYRKRRDFDAYIAGLQAETARRKASPDYEEITGQTYGTVTSQVYGQVTDEVGGQVTARFDPETGYFYDQATGERIGKYGSGKPYPGAREDGYRALRELDEERRALPSVYDQVDSNVWDQVRADEAADAREAAEPHRYSDGP